MRNLRLVLLGAILLLRLPAPAHADETEAWFTGSLNSTGADALPGGAFLAEPYLADVMAHPKGGPSSHTAESFNLLLYGMTDDLIVGVIPRFAYRDAADIGDLTARVQYRLAPYDAETGLPALALSLNQTFPTGRHDNLNDAGTNGTGTGAYVTSLSVLTDEYSTLPGGNLVRERFDVSYAVSSRVGVENRSVYGTQDGFWGHASPGAHLDATFALEVSLTTRWALALDISYDRDGNSRVWGDGLRWDSGSSQSINLVPAIEYNFTADTGLIIGVQMPVWQHNTPVLVVPMAALNCVF